MLETAIVVFATYNEQLRWGFRREGKCENSKPGSLYTRKKRKREKKRDNKRKKKVEDRT